MQTEYEPNSFERFILHNRIYCEHEGCRFKLTPAIRVLSLYKNPVAVCEEHWQEDQPIEREQPCEKTATETN